MRGRQGREFELVMGNKQLLLVFFIVVVLLCVFFTMGYVVGRNTGPAEVAQAGEAEKGEPAAVRAEARVEEAQVAGGAEEDVGGTEEASGPTEAAEGSGAAAAAGATGRQDEPEPGQLFLQVAATNRTDAEKLMGALDERGFQVRLAPVPGDPRIRVLVGPIEGGEELVKLRARLQELGFKPFPRKY